MKAAVSKAVPLRECPLGGLPLYVKKVVDYFISYLRDKNPCVEVVNESGTSHTGYTRKLSAYPFPNKFSTQHKH